MTLCCRFQSQFSPSAIQVKELYARVVHAVLKCALILHLVPELTLPILLNFPGKEPCINLAEMIGTNSDFGTLILEDEWGNKCDAIKAENNRVADINREVLRRWLQGEGRQPVKWSTLVKTLRDCNLNVLAQKIQAVTAGASYI